MAGIALARLDSIAWSVSIGLVAAAALLLVLHLRRFPWPTDVRVAVFLLAGFLWGWCGLLADASKMVVDASWIQEPVKFSGRITDVLSSPAGMRLALTDVRRQDGAVLAGDLWLYSYPKRGATRVWLRGERIVAGARLHEPRNHHNPSGFDFEAWCFDRHIALLGSATQTPRLLSPNASALEHLRLRIRRALDAFPDARGGVLRAMLLGERGDIPERVSEVFAATGAAHLLAISGLHVGLVAGFGLGMVWWLLTRRERWMVNLPVRGLALVGGVMLALIYAQLAGWPLPTQRAALMLVAGGLAWWLSARAAPLNVMLGALMLVLLIDPAAITSLSLWLSFAATSGILLWADSLRDVDTPAWRSWLAGLVGVTLVAWLVTLPMVADVFGRLPLYSLPANLLATPLYTLFVLPVSLAGAGLAAFGWDAGAHGMFWLAGRGVELGNALLVRISQWPAGNLLLPDVPLWLAVLYVVGLVAAMFLWRGQRRLAGAALACLCLVAYGMLAMHEQPAVSHRLIAWDVGQGAAISLHWPGGVMVVDASGRRGSRFNAGTTMAGGFRDMGLAHLDILVISHDQSDHAGGALSLVRRMNRVGELWLADVPRVKGSARMARLRAEVERRGGRVRWLARGDRVTLPGIQARVLWPPAGYAPGNVNLASLVLLVSPDGGNRWMFPGDIEAPVERMLLEDVNRLIAEGLPVQGLLLPHHGSESSSTPGFVQLLRPVLAVAQTGYANRYGFPAEAVVNRYRAAGSKVLDTSEGAIVVEPDPRTGLSAYHTPHVESQRRSRALQWSKDFL